ncbi:MAG: fibronectin type III domain-containing protein, partial [Candidatus Cloacimonadales bacterium]
INLQINATDPLDKALSLSVMNLPAQATFTDNGAGSGVIAWETDYYSAGVYNLVITATNADNLSSQLAVSLIIENIPQSPQFITLLEDITFQEDQTYTVYYLPDYVVDSDLTEGDTLSVSITDNVNINLAYSDGYVIFSAPADWFGTEIVTISISDTYGFEINQVVVVTVINVNDEPTMLADFPIINIDEDYLDYTLDLEDYFADLDNQLHYSVQGNENIDFIFEGSVLNIQPHQDWFGTETVQVTATEGAVLSPDNQAIAGVSTGLSLSSELVIVVNPINDVPVITALFPELAILVNTSSALDNVSSYFFDVDSELTYSFSGNNNIAIEFSGDSLTLTPNQGWLGIERITVTATDDFNLSVSQVLVVKVQVGYIYSENFNHEGSLPTGWTKSGGNWNTRQDSGEDWSVEVINPQLSRVQRLVSAPINLSGVYSVEVSFRHELVKPNGVTAILQYSLNGLTYYNVENFSESHSGFYTVQIPEINNQQSVRLRWQYTSATVATNSWQLDDLSINGLLGSYLPPSNVEDLTLVEANPEYIKLEWTPITNNFFNQYEISVMSDSTLTAQLFIWNGSDDNTLFSSTTNTTIINELTTNTKYYFAIRSTDLSGNTSAWSTIISAVPTSQPVINFLTANDKWFNTLSPVIEVQITDDFMISASSLAYRLDSNNNGIYDEGEDWLPIANYHNSNELIIEIPLSLDSDGLDYKLEVKCTDTQNSFFSYSGTESVLGIEDDFTFNVDTIAPAIIENLLTSEVAETSVTVEWEASSDTYFSHYTIYYAIHNNPTSADNIYSKEANPNLAISSTTTATLTNLDPAQRYWLVIVAYDLAHNCSDLSNHVANVLASDLLIISDVNPVQGDPFHYINSREVVLSCKMKDAYGIDYSSVQYRFDANGNGQYDSSEEWAPVSDVERKSLRTNNSTLDENGDYVLEVQAIAEYLVDGEELKFEFRAKDVNGYGYVYSGFDNLEGSGDDWSVNIDSIAPTAITAIQPGYITTSTAQIAWSSSSDDNFVGYKIFFGNEAGITLEADNVSWLDYPELAEAGAGQILFNLTNLTPNAQYFVRVGAFDIASNATLSSEISFATINDSRPRTPENLTLTFAGSDLILAWDAVTTDEHGNTIENVVYDIYFSETPEFELDGSNYFDTVEDNEYIFYEIGDVLPVLFFKIQAISD